MSAPRTKRQFAGAACDPAQRQITSFFTSTGATTAPSAATTSPSSSTLTINTAAPRTFGASSASDQANLISVGMRVRKAVPEGYKTGTYSAFPLWDDEHDTMPTSPGETGRSRANAVSTPRELTPFCGIHRVGGLQMPASDCVGPTFEIQAPAHDMPGLTLSQESAASHDSSSSGVTGAKTRKRFFVDDDEETPDMPDRLSVAQWQDGEVSPRSLVPVGWNNGRTMAVPRKGRLRGKLNGGPGMTAGQENVVVDDGDFEEAPFLDRQWEVEMSDV